MVVAARETARYAPPQARVNAKPAAAITGPRIVGRMMKCGFWFWGRLRKKAATSKTHHRPQRLMYVEVPVLTRVHDVGS